MPTIPSNGKLRVLDPGAGVGSLAVALAERVLSESPEVELEITCLEFDESLRNKLLETIEELNRSGVQSRAIFGDYLKLSSASNIEEKLLGSFDIVIQNPPYGKLASKSPQRAFLKKLGVDCPNMYAAFMAVGHRCLKENGQLVSIVPRSFANGAYFREFRADLLDSLAIRRIHEFDSRKSVFADTGVLQENIVLTGVKSTASRVTISRSSGDSDAIRTRELPYADIVWPDDEHQFIRLPLDGAVVSSPRCLLSDLGIRVSTGKVVDFRAKDYLTSAHESGAVPLIYPGNMKSGKVEWPLAIGKPQGFKALAPVAKKQVLPEGVYILIKRFSAKEERRRVVAAIWNGSGDVAVENHVNVLHSDGRGLDVELASGLNIWLNSSRLDRIFREFSGSTQVNATDIRVLPFPDVRTLRKWGAEFGARLPEESTIESIVEGTL